MNLSSMPRRITEKAGSLATRRPALMLVVLGIIFWSGFALPTAARAAELSPLESLGKQLFFDRNLSNPRGQACASCHDPASGFTGPESNINFQTGIHPGAVKNRFGNRKPPTAAYATFSPPFHFDETAGEHVGGQFWDGRARDLAEQAGKPLLNPVEQNVADTTALFKKLRAAAYRPLFEQVHGAGTLDDSRRNVEQILPRVTAAIAAYESSAEVNPFSSKYDAFLAGKVQLADQEAKGLKLFEGQAKCAKCHLSKPSSDGKPPLLTDYKYDNLGVPRNTRNPYYAMATAYNSKGADYVDLGLGGALNKPELYGRFKSPTLRNVDRRPNANFVKAYMHNGYFKSLKDVVHFYNVRDSHPEAFPKPEFAETVNHDELGNLGLTDEQENAIVAFMKTLTDGYTLHAGSQDAEADVASPDSPAIFVDRAAHFEGAKDAARIQRYLIHRQRSAKQGSVDPLFRR